MTFSRSVFANFEFTMIPVNSVVAQLELSSAQFHFTTLPTVIVLPLGPDIIKYFTGHAKQNAQADKGEDKEKNSKRTIHLYNFQQITLDVGRLTGLGAEDLGHARSRVTVT
jgi:hypothetical protein